MEPFGGHVLQTHDSVTLSGKFQPKQLLQVTFKGLIIVSKCRTVGGLSTCRKLISKNCIVTVFLAYDAPTNRNAFPHFDWLKTMPSAREHSVLKEKANIEHLQGTAGSRSVAYIFRV